MQENELFDLLFEQGNDIRQLRDEISRLKEEAILAERTILDLIEGFCLGVIPNTFIACGEGGFHCSSACHLHANLRAITEREAATNRAYEELKEYLHEKIQGKKEESECRRDTLPYCEGPGSSRCSD